MRIRERRIIFEVLRTVLIVPAASRRSLNVAYREEDGCKPKKKKKIKKKSRKIDTRPVDDGSEKMYRQRIR